MTARATNADVNELLDTTGKTYTLAIESANVLVNETLGDAGLSDDRLTMIERFLAAHFAILSTQGGGIARRSVGESSETYRTPKESMQGLNSTVWGQQALAADTTGTLSALGSGGLKAEFRVV